MIAPGQMLIKRTHTLQYPVTYMFQINRNNNGSKYPIRDVQLIAHIAFITPDTHSTHRIVVIGKQCSKAMPIM